MDSVKVAIRIRPLIARERGAEEIWCADTQKIQLKDGRRDPYIFDRVFGSDETTSDVYEEIVEPIVESAMTGFNGTVFAYGQTSSGKTYTMMGGGSNSGIIPLSVRDTFAHIQKTPEREFLLRVCYMEIYNEVVRDLLVADASGLQIREDEFRNAVVQGLTEKVVGSEDEVLELIRLGDKRRRTGCTNMNERSSRSHTIFRMILESRERVDPNTTKDSVEFDTAVKISQLNLVDLAGSERAHQAGTEGQRFKEGCHINKSLLTLGVVINQICKASETGQSAQFISYRDSKLTRILQPSLGGNSLTAIICAVTPVSYDDTDSTLRFASNAKKIKNKPHVNEVLSDEALLYRQKREINQLKKRIRELELNTGKKKNEELETMLNEKEKLQKEQEERIATLKKIILVSTQPVDNAKKQRNTRRETWCPGKLKAGTGVAATTSCDMNFMSQSSLFQIDQHLLGVEFEPMVKRTKYSDGDLLPKKSDLTSDATVASEHFATLEDELILMRSQHEQLEEDLRNARQEKDADKFKIMRMQEEMDWQKENLNEVFDEKTAVEAENLKLQNKILEQNSRISDFVKKERQWLNSNPETSSLKEIQNDLEQQLQDVCSQNCRLQLKNDEDRTSIRRLQSKLDDVTIDLKGKEDSLEEYKNQVSSLQSQLEATFASGKSHSSSLSVTGADSYFKRQYEDLEAELKEKNEEISRLTRELEDKIEQNEMDEVLDQLQRQTSENCQLKRLVEDLKKVQSVENPHSKSHVVETLNESGKIGEKTFIRDCIESCEEMADKNNKLEEQIEALQKENDQLKMQMEGKFGEMTMENAVAEYDEVMQEKKALLEQVVELKEEIKMLHLQDNDQRLRIQSLTEHQEFIDMEKEICTQQEKEQEEKISSLENEISKLNEQIVTLQSLKTVSADDANVGQDTDMKMLREENNTLRKSSVDAQAMLQEANKKYAIANTTVEAQEKEIETLKKELECVRSDLDSFNSMAELTKEKYEKKVQELSQQLQLTYDQIQDGGTKPGEVQNCVGEIEEFKIRLDEKEYEIDDLKKRLTDSSSELEKMKSSIQDYKNMVESMKHDLKNARLARDVDDISQVFGMNVEEVKEKISIVDDLLKQRDDLILVQQEKSDKILSLEESLKIKETAVVDEELTNKLSELEAALKERDSKLEEIHLSHEKQIKELESVKTTLQENEEQCTSDGEKVEELRRSQEETIVKLQNELDDATSKRQELEKRLDEVSYSMTDDEKNLRDMLTGSRRELAEMTEKYERLNTVTQHAQGALLAETNRDLDHQRQLQISETQRKESQLVMANERESANKQINKLLTKVSELQTSLSRTELEKDVACRERSKATEECEFLRQQVKSLESIQKDEGSIVPRGQVLDPEKMAQRIKKLCTNLEYANQIQEKLKTTNANLTDENKKLEREAIKVMELEAEVGKLKGILEQERNARTDSNARYTIQQQEANAMRDRIVELGKQLKEAKDQCAFEADKLAGHFESSEEEKRILRADIDKLRNRIKELDSKIKKMSQKDEETLAELKLSLGSIEELKLQLEANDAEKNETTKCIESLQDRIEHSSLALDEEKKKNTEREQSHSLLMSDMSKVSDELDKKRMLVNELKERNDLLLQSVENMKEKLATKNEEVKNVRDDSAGLDELERNLQNAQNMLKEVQNERDCYITKMSDMKQAFEDELAHKDEVMKDLTDQADSENVGMSQKISALEKMKIDNERILDETKSTLSSKIQELEILSEEKRVFEEKISMLESERNKNGGDDLGKETSYHIMKDQLDEVNREKEILLEKIRELEVAASLKEEKFQQQTSDAKSDDFEEKISNLEAELETVIMDKETTHKLLEERNQEHESAVCEYKTMLNERDEKIKALQESDNESLLNELNNLKCELEKKQKEIDESKNQLGLLMSQKKHGDVSEYGMEFSNSFDQEMIDQLYEQVAELKLQVEEKNDVIQGLKLTSPTTDTRDEEITNLKEETQELKKQLESFAESIKEKDETILSLQIQKTAEDVTAQNEDTDLTDKNFKESCSEEDSHFDETKSLGLTNELDALRKKTVEQADKNTRLRSLLDTQGDEMASLRKQLQDLGQSLESENGHIVQLKQAKRDAEDKICTLQRETEGWTNAKQTCVNTDDQEKQEILEKCSKLECSLQETETKLADTIQLLHESNEAKEEAVAQRLEKENELERHRSQLANLQDCESAMISAKEAVIALEQQLDELASMKKDEIAQKEGQIIELKEKLENFKELKLKHQKLVEENHALEMRVTESVEGRDAKISELENLLEAKEKEFKSERFSLESEITHLNQETSSLNEDLESVYAMIREKAALMEESASSREALEKNIDELRLENDMLKSKLEDASTQQITTSADLSEDIVKAEKRIEELLQNNATIEKDRDGVAFENEKYKHEVVALEKDIHEAVDKIQDLQSELDNVKCENENLIEEQKRETNSKRTARDSEALIMSLQDEVKMMQETKDTLEKRIAEVQKESEMKEEILKKDWEKNMKDLEGRLKETENARTKIQATLYKELEDEQEGQRYLAIEIADVKAKLAEKEVELEKTSEEMKGLLYKKELQVQTLQSDILGWERRHQEDKWDMENAIKLAKEDMVAMEAENGLRVKELQSKLDIAEQQIEKLKIKVKAVDETEGSNVDASNQHKAELEAKISELILNIESLKENHKKELSAVEESVKTDKKKLWDKIDDYEQGLFEQDRDLEEEKSKTKTLEKKIADLENNLKTVQSTSSNSASSKTQELRQRFERKLAGEKKKYEELDWQLRVEKQRNTQLTTKLEEYKRNAGTDVDFARESLAKRQMQESYEEKLKKLEVDFENKMKGKIERMESMKKALNDRIAQLENSCIESETELDQVKQKNNDLNMKLEELKSSSDEEDKRKLHKELSSKESEVTRLQIQLKSCTEPMERENCQLKEELKLCEDRIDNLKQQVKRAAGSASAERQEAVGRITRSSLRSKPTSQPGVVRESRMYILEMEISDNEHRIRFLEKELAKYKDIEVKRRGENMELLEENKKYRSLIKKAREKRLGSSDVLTENTNILNQDPASASGTLPKQHTVHDDKCKNQ